MLPSDIGLPRELFHSFRQGQEKAILTLSTQLEEAPHSLLKAPTGTGKSLITVATALYTGKRALYLVQQHAHQDQVMRDFSPVGMVEVRGHKNYPCAIHGWKGAGDGEVDTECSENPCYWRQAINIAAGSQLVCMNYSLWLSLAKAGLTEELGTFDLLIIDEAHSVPDIVCEQAGVDLSLWLIEDVMDNYPFDLAQINTLERAESLARELARVITQHLAEAKESGTLRSPYNKRLQRVMAGMRRFLGRDKLGGEQWVIHDTGKRDVLALRPVWAKSYTHSLLIQGVPNAILTSATLYDFLITFLGIEKRDTLSHSMASPFSPMRHPFYYIPRVKVTHGMSGESIGRLAYWIEEIALLHWRTDDSRKGIIHTHSYRLLEQLIPRMRYPHLFTYPTRGRKSGPVFEEFLRSSGPLAYIGPAKEEGIDLKDDLARFSILAKVPLPYRKDPLTRARIHSDEGGEIYADYLTALSVEQSVGRAQRTERDWGYGHILDSNWGWFHKRWNWSSHFSRTWVDTWYTEGMELPRVPAFN